uniref:Uncharacterized protein n=1 Tax=Lepeophtheirus salmonis TaxID=72036 RepID=A0A0K2UC76_LEPSM
MLSKIKKTLKRLVSHKGVFELLYLILRAYSSILHLTAIPTPNMMAFLTN